MQGRNQPGKEPIDRKEELLSIHAMNRLVKRERPDRVFMASVQGKGDEEEGNKTRSDWQKCLCKDLDPSLKGVLEEHKEVFQHDLPAGVPPVRKGHEFKIELEDQQPPVHQPIYKMSPKELQ